MPRGNYDTGRSAAGLIIGRNTPDAERLEEFVLFGPVAFGARVLAGEDQAVADLGHPAGACKMAVDCLAGALRLPGRVDAKDRPGYVVAAGACFIGVEQTEVGLVMPVVVFGDVVGPWDFVGDLRIGIGHHYPLEVETSTKRPGHEPGCGTIADGAGRGP